MTNVPLSSTAVAVLLEVAGQDRPTVRSVAVAVDRSTGVVHLNLRRLRDAGLVTWTVGARGTLRATVAAVPFGVELGAVR